MLKTSFIRGIFRKPIKPPPWWEGHVIHFKTYPFGHGYHSCSTLTLSDPGAGKQRFAPYSPGQFITVSVGGKRMRGQISQVDVHRPGWLINQNDRDTFDPDEDPGDWLLTIDFPRIVENRPPTRQSGQRRQ
jgi:hypothetical protein